MNEASPLSADDQDDRESGQCTAVGSESFERCLVSGGDERIAITPSTGRNRYGTPAGKATDEVWFSSSTAGAISARGYEAALRAYHSSVSVLRDAAISDWFDGIRKRLNDLFGVQGSEVVLSASGTDLELIVLFLAQGIFARPLTNIVIAPDETGRGVLFAAAGRHFLASTPFATSVKRGSHIEGLSVTEPVTEAVQIRDEHGRPLAPECIDSLVVERVEASVNSQRSALVHLLDCSKTNYRGLQRSTASALMRQYPGQVLVVVDSCQLRCSPEQIRADLQAGFMVMITGSKFAGGPPFSGALLLPPGIVERAGRLDLPRGLLAYTAAADWPVTLRQKFTGAFEARCNIGAGLRWEAALAELEKLFGLPIALRSGVVEAFSDAVRKLVDENPQLELVDAEFESLRSDRTIFPIVTAARDGKLLECDTIYSLLRRSLPGSETSRRIFHLGQPVPVGHRKALRICLSAAHIVDVAHNMAAGQSVDRAFAPLTAELDALFLKWKLIIDELSH